MFSNVACTSVHLKHVKISLIWNCVDLVKLIYSRPFDICQVFIRILASCGLGLLLEINNILIKWFNYHKLVWKACCTVLAVTLYVLWVSQIMKTFICPQDIFCFALWSHFLYYYILMSLFTTPFSSTTSSTDEFHIRPNFLYKDKLRKQYACGLCKDILLQPHQTACGTRFVT